MKHDFSPKEVHDLHLHCYQLDFIFHCLGTTFVYPTLNSSSPREMQIYLNISPGSASALH